MLFLHSREIEMWINEKKFTEREMCMTWKETDGREERNVFHQEERQAEGRVTGREKGNGKLCKKWLELMLMDQNKYYF